MTTNQDKIQTFVRDSVLEQYKVSTLTTLFSETTDVSGFFGPQAYEGLYGVERRNESRSYIEGEKVRSIFCLPVEGSSSLPP